MSVHPSPPSLCTVARMTYGATLAGMAFTLAREVLALTRKADA